MKTQRPLPGGYTRGVAGDPYREEAENGDERETPVGAIACKDLISYSRLASAVRAAGYTPLQVEGPEAVRAAADHAAFILVDLQDPAGGLAAVRAARQGAPDAVVYAIGPHVETQLLQAARDAGAAHVLTHNAASRQLGELLMRPNTALPDHEDSGAARQHKTPT